MDDLYEIFQDESHSDWRPFTQDEQRREVNRRSANEEQDADGTLYYALDKEP